MKLPHFFHDWEYITQGYTDIYGMGMTMPSGFGFNTLRCRKCGRERKDA